MDSYSSLLSALKKKDWAAAYAILNETGMNIEEKNVRDETVLYFCALNGHLEAAEWLLSQGADINTQDKSGDTILLKAIEAQNRELVEWILKQSPDVNIQNDRGSSALSLASSFSDNQISLAILNAGADVTLKTKRKNTALLTAAARGNLELMTEFLNKGASPKEVEMQGISVLQSAILSMNEDLVVWFLETHGHAIDINHATNSGSTAIMYAAERGMVRAIDKMLDLGANPNIVSANKMNNGITPLMVLATKPGSVAVIEKAIAAGADVNAKMTGGGATALSLALLNKELDMEIVEKLVEGGANVNEPLIVDSGGEKFAVSPYFAAIAAPKEKKPAKKPASYPGTPPGGSAGNMIAQLMGGGPEKEVLTRLEIAEKLMDLGFSINGEITNGKSNNDISPLESALKIRDAELVDFFLRNGARPDLENAKGGTALTSLATMKMMEKEQAAISLLMQMGAKGGTDESKTEQITKLKESFSSFVKETLQKFLSIGVSVNAVNGEGNTLLMECVRAKNVDVLEYLLQNKNVDFSIKNEVGDDVFVIALKEGVDEIFKKLSAVSALQDSIVLDAVYSSPESFEKREAFLKSLSTLEEVRFGLNYQDENGNTPLIVAAATNQDDVVNILLEMGADVNLTNKFGENALMHAVLSESPQMVQKIGEFSPDLSQKTVEGKDVFALSHSVGSQRTVRALMGIVPAAEPKMKVSI